MALRQQTIEYFSMEKEMTSLETGFYALLRIRLAVKRGEFVSD